ncbi:putative cysteine peptidase Clan CA family C2 [Trypanosoma vivax]|uniref:Putative calpain-like cysteine peptidase n=1 Tax=Trypanosoma vivax (strain Y486) TaxID=1055687 RepID=G0U2G4_TRYVY|nr:putative cysteine peptidase Clan CA family C2 [Trypanosoma vivax]CCC50467.1 putative calpain-like cysteine peptidase [Trypanosoma vivax Y486]
MENINYAGEPGNVEATSCPVTEAGPLDAASVFSSSVDLDTAEKMGSSKAAAPANGHQTTANAAAEEEATTLYSCALDELPLHVQHAQSALKPRKLPLKQPLRWLPLQLALPQQDLEYEFDVSTAKMPVYEDEKKDEARFNFLNGEPDMTGEIISCFEEPGILYRIVDKKMKVWAFYNDSLQFEVHVACVFGKHSKLEALENTTLHSAPDGSTIAEVVVYPTETERFVKGFVNGFSSKLRALPLSNEYFEERRALQHRGAVEVEMNSVKDLTKGDMGAEERLLACVRNGVAFVDMDFPPLQPSISSGTQMKVPPLPWFRPRMYLPSELVSQMRLFRKPIVPGDVVQGNLGDCWLMCAVATLAEMPEEIMRMFRHPKSAAAARDERSIGAYRVTLNKSGLWQSIIVDDYLPFIVKAPWFAHSSDSCELWPAILQKAYAKVHGSYGRVQSGDPVHALTDMSGCPSLRFDESFSNAHHDGGEALFEQLLEYHQVGYQILLSTAGSAPALLEGEKRGGDVDGHGNVIGLVPGHTYTVVDVRHFPQDGDVKLLKIRNVWGTHTLWSGPWSAGSSEWAHKPSLARVCNIDDENHDRCIWMDWRHVLRHFNGGGVHFHRLWFDYRIPFVFADCRPSVAVEVVVDSPVSVCFILSNIDRRGMTVDSDDAGAVAGEGYPPLMLSLSSKLEQSSTDYHVIQNSSVNITRPSTNKWTFIRAREIGMMCELTPEKSPYLLIPRMMESESTVGAGSTAWFTRLQGKVHPIHFANRMRVEDSKGRQPDVAEVPVVLGIRSAAPVGPTACSNIHVNFRCIGEGNCVFENFPRFAGDSTPLDDVYYQRRHSSRGSVEEERGASLS